MKHLLMVSLLAAVALAGCSGSGGEDDICGKQDDQGRYVVCMTGANRYEPSTLQVPVGASVVWINQGGVHNTEEVNGLWVSDINGDEENHVQVFDEAGTYNYECRPHASQGMKGTIIVS
ncbi:MAG: cupredoxin domain-containing protein [Thermoplasmatota archaeon]